MTNDKDSSEKVLDELAVLRLVPFAELVGAIAASRSFYGEGDIPLPKKEG